MSDGSLDSGGVSDGGMNVCVHDVVCDVIDDAVDGGGVSGEDDGGVVSKVE